MDFVFAHGGLAGFPDMDEMMLALPGLPALLMGTIVTGTLLQRRGALAAERTVALAWVLALVAATLSIGAAAIHLAVLEEHAARDINFGVFFLVVGGAQLAWPQLYLLWPSRWLAWAGIAGNLAVVGVWVVSRTVGLPFGPTPGVPESVGLLDLLATTYELGVVAALMLILFRARDALGGERRVTPLDAFIGAGFLALLVAGGTAVALIWSLTGD